MLTQNFKSAMLLVIICQDISGCEHGGDQQPDMQSVDPHVNQQGVDMLYNNQRQFYEQLKVTS